MKWLFIWTHMGHIPEDPMFEIVECSLEDLPEKMESKERNIEMLTVVPADKVYRFLKDNLHGEGQEVKK